MSPICRAQLAERIAALPPVHSIVNDPAHAMNCRRVELADVDSSSFERGFARTVFVAPSAIDGRAHGLAAVHDAAAALGLRNVRTFVTAMTIRNRVPYTAVQGFDHIAFWRHSIGVALCGRALASRGLADPDEAFIAGLLHDVGRAVLAATFPERYAETLAFREREDCPLVDAERASLGVDHCDAGSMLAKHWEFDAALTDAVRFHHAPGATEPTSLAALTHVGDVIATALDLAQVEDARLPAIDASAWDAQRFDEAAFHAICSATLAPFQLLCAALGV